jgi:hypothetical protein
MYGSNSQRIQIFVEVLDQKTQLGHRQGPGSIGIKLGKSFLVGEKVLLHMIKLSLVSQTTNCREPPSHQDNKWSKSED